METDERWLKRPQSTIGQRNVDKELQRIKRLAVVSVLNKSFQDTAPPLRPSSSLLPSMSPSSSLTTSGTSQDAPSKPRSHSISNPSSQNSLKKTSNISLHGDYTTMRRSERNEDQISLSEKEMDDNRLVTSSPIDSEKEILENRVLELEALYSASIKELHTVSDRNNAQTKLVSMQDNLIHQLTDQIEDLSSVYKHIQYGPEDVEAILKSKEELHALNEQLDELRPLKAEYMNLIERLTENDRKLEELEQIAKEIQKENAAQTSYIDTKVQTLLNKLLQKNEIINKLEQQQQQRSIAPTPEMISKSSDLKSLNDSSSVIWEHSGEDDGNTGLSARSSYIASENNSQHRKSLIARWKGPVLPPASPPPTLPLPPIPTTSSHSRPKSTLSELSKRSSIASYNKHLSIDAIGGSSQRRPSAQSEIDVEIADTAYYKEFTDQLQQRLSISKEIDDLRVWEPSDYDSIQRKIESNNWSGSDDGNSQKDQAAFWKGMKKKLRV